MEKSIGPIRCAECGRYVGHDDIVSDKAATVAVGRHLWEDDPEPVIVFLCPRCTERDQARRK